MTFQNNRIDSLNLTFAHKRWKRALRSLVIPVFLVFIGIFSVSLPATAQPGTEHQLAIQFYNSGDYAKAMPLFESLLESVPGSQFYYKYLLNCQVNLGDFKQAEKTVKRRIKVDPVNPTLLVDMGYVLAQAGELDKSKKAYYEAIASLRPDQNAVVQLASSFLMVREYDFAIETYTAGKRLVPSYPFSLELGNLYRDMKDDSRMISNYLDYVAFAPERAEYVQNILQDYITEDAQFMELQRQIYRKIQEVPDNPMFPEMLIWMLIQKKDFEGAFVQVRALDKRFRENGKRVYDLAQTAMNAEAYAIARLAFEFLVEKGSENSFFIHAREGLLIARKKMIISTPGYAIADLLELEKDYETFIREFQFNRFKAAQVIRELAHLEAVYLKNLPKAITLIESLNEVGGLNQIFVSECKLDLGDYYLMAGDPWESTLLYSQVDKKMKDEPLGEMARFRNARLSYFKGEFLWAQAQLNILKASTSELIANDALDLSVFITDHLGLDTTSLPLTLYSGAELLALQNRQKEALIKLDSITGQFPSHSLVPNTYYMRAGFAEGHGNYQESFDLLGKIVKEHPQSILVDDALMRQATMLETFLNNKEMAMEIYQKILLDHTGSIFVVEARKRFRHLRGDNLNQP